MVERKVLQQTSEITEEMERTGVRLSMKSGAGFGDL